MQSLQEYCSTHDTSTINDIIKDLTDYEKEYLRLHLKNSSLILYGEIGKIDTKQVKANNKFMQPLFEKMDHEQRIRMGWIFENRFEIKDWNNIL